MSKPATSSNISKVKRVNYFLWPSKAKFKCIRRWKPSLWFSYKQYNIFISSGKKLPTPSVRMRSRRVRAPVPLEALFFVRNLYFSRLFHLQPCSSLNKMIICTTQCWQIYVHLIINQLIKCRKSFSGIECSSELKTRWWLPTNSTVTKRMFSRM